MVSSGRRPRRRSRRWLVMGLFFTALIITTNAALSAQSGAPARSLSTQNFFDVVLNDVQRSTQSGLDVQEVRADALTLGRDGILRRLDRLVTDTDSVAREVRGVGVPKNLRDARDLLVAALTLRARAAVALRQAYDDALGTPAPNVAVSAMVDVGKDILASDRVYRLFTATLPSGLATIPDSQWEPDDAAWTQPELDVFVASLRSSTSLAPVHDVKIVVVSTDPGPVGQEGGNEVLPISTTLNVQIVVANVGNEPEKQLTVTASLSTAADGSGASSRDFVDLVPGQRRTITLGHLRPLPNTVTILTVHIQPAPGQLNLQDTEQTLDFVMR